MASRRSLAVLTAVVVMVLLGLSRIGSAQSPTYGVGRTPSAEEIRAWDIAISPTGKELPTGHGTATEGAVLYVRKGCAGCHGVMGSGTHAPTLISRTAFCLPYATFLDHEFMSAWNR